GSAPIVALPDPDGLRSPPRPDDNAVGMTAQWAGAGGLRSYGHKRRKPFKPGQGGLRVAPVARQPGSRSDTRSWRRPRPVDLVRLHRPGWRATGATRIVAVPVHRRATWQSSWGPRTAPSAADVLEVGLDLDLAPAE